MIKEVTGDILLTNAAAIAHGVAPNDHFDSGLALSLRERQPDLYKDFRHHCKVHSPKTGSAWFWKGEGQQVVNLFTQAPSSGHGGHPGKAHLNDVNHALKELAKIAKAENLESIALPRLATGVGGLDWQDVEPLVKTHLGELGIPIFVYTTFVKGVAAKE
ncbi:MAG: macro domain-containing protein [Saprospiraceae bacterium]|nr:macro domain-containing protein [Saprospiraceae bacterium]